MVPRVLGGGLRPLHTQSRVGRPRGADRHPHWASGVMCHLQILSPQMRGPGQKTSRVSSSWPSLVPGSQPPLPPPLPTSQLALGSALGTTTGFRTKEGRVFPALGEAAAPSCRRSIRRESQALLPVSHFVGEERVPGGNDKGLLSAVGTGALSPSQFAYILNGDNDAVTAGWLKGVATAQHSPTHSRC